VDPRAVVSRRLGVAAGAWRGPTLIAVVGLAMVAWTWRTWPDPLVDYGREVYLAWQIAKGRTLYVDLAYFNGPLAPYANGLVFRVFGPGILILAAANALVAGACVAMLYALLVRTADRLAATLAGLTFVTVFATLRLIKVGNNNWLCPYSHDLPHGVALGVASLWCLDRYQRTRSTAWMGAIGVAVGLVALTKTEVLIATGAAVALGIVLTLAREPPDGRRRARLAVALAGGALVPLGIAFVFFARHMPVAEVLRWPLGFWHAAARPEFIAMPMYQEGLGIDDPLRNLGRLAAALGRMGMVLAPGLAGAFVLRHRRGPLPPIALAVTTGLVTWWLVPTGRWLEMARPLPVLLALIVGGVLVAWGRAGADAARSDRLALIVALATFGLVLLAKMALNVRVQHYGFALAMPATLVLVAALVTWGPAAVVRAGGNGSAARAVAAALVLAAIAGVLANAQPRLARQTERLGTGVDAFYGDDRTGPLRELLDALERHVGPSASVVALPEGIMLNYLGRWDSSVRYVQYSPLSVILWGEERLLADFERTPPDFIALVHRDNSHEGARIFGRDYGRGLRAWVDANYRPVWRTGAPPLEDGRVGMALLARDPGAQRSAGQR
jgi:hypothetical protein